MRKLFMMIILTMGVQEFSIANCFSCSDGNGDTSNPIDDGTLGPDPVYGDDLPHHARVLYYRSGFVYHSTVWGMDKASCRTELDLLARDSNNIVIEVTLPCTPI